MPAINEWWMLFALMHPADEAAGPAAALHIWSVEPGVVLPLVAMLCVYVAGVVRLWRAGGVGAGIRRWQAAAFIGGCATIAAAPLLVAGMPVLAIIFALPVSARRPAAAALRVRWVARPWSVLIAPATVWLLHALALWVW